MEKEREKKEKETKTENGKETSAPATKRKPYIYPHRHCVYCGRMIEVKGRDYCLRCKPEYQKEVSKRSRAQKFQKFMKFYIIGIIILLVGIVLYSLR